MKKNSTKEQLQKQLNRIAEQEHSKMVEENYPKHKVRFEGKFFKYKNSYSCPSKPSDYWYIYTKVLSIKPEDIYEGQPGLVLSSCKVYSFQIHKYGNLTVEVDKRSYTHSLGKEISEDEFNKGFNKMVELINGLK